MSERDDRYVGNDGLRLPQSTSEFRATPDVSGSTAEFRAFVAGQAGGTRQTADVGSWPEQPWDAGAPVGPGRTVWLVGGGIVLALVVVLILVFA